MKKETLNIDKKGYMFHVSRWGQISITTAEEDFKNTWSCFKTLGEAKKHAFEHAEFGSGGSRADFNYFTRHCVNMESLWNDYVGDDCKFINEDIDDLTVEIDKLSKRRETLRLLNTKFSKLVW